MNTKTSRAAWVLAACMVCVPVWAQVKVEGAWARATVQGQKATGAFMKLTADKALKLVSVSSPAAGLAEIHEMKMDGDVMKMRALNSVDIPAGSVVSVLKGNPNGYHVMLLGLKKPLKEGDKFPLRLSFKKAGEVEVEVVVQAADPAVKHEEHKH